MRKIRLFIPLFLFFSITAFGQDFNGFNTSNFAGIIRMESQPASIVGSPYKWDINILSIDAIGENANFFTNLASVDRLAIGHNSLLNALDAGRSDYMIAGNILLPAVSYQFGEKSAVGFSAKARFNFFAKGNDGQFSNLFFGDTNIGELIGNTYNDLFLSTRLSTWTEYNFTYARTLLDNDQHTFRVGITPKLLVAQGAAYSASDNLSFSVDDENTLTALTGFLEFGYSESVDETIQDGDFKLFGKNSLGLSLGFEYELKSKAKATDIRYDPGYQLKIGLSYVDIGFIKFQSADNSNSYAINVPIFNLNDVRNVESLEELADTLNQKFLDIQSKSSFNMRLPTAFRFQIDYKIRKFLYANFSGAIATSGNNDETFQMKNFNSYALTLRYEKPLYGFSLPISYNEVVDFNVGLSARFGPLFLGSGNAISYLIGGKSGFVSAYFGLKIPILKKEYRRKND